MKILTLELQGTLADSDFAPAVRALQRGELIVYPTDTLYGLGADVHSESAVDELYRLKARQDAPVSVLLESVDQLLEIARGLSPKARHFIQTFLPGPVTVICFAEHGFSKRLVSNRGTLGCRVPSDPVSTRLARLLGGPITTTSVNPAGQIPANSLESVVAYYQDQIGCMIDVGEFKPSRGSTIIDLTTTPFTLIREGEIPRHELEEFLN